MTTYEKACKVIRSCTTREHLRCALKYVMLANVNLDKTYRMALHDELRTKIHEIIL